MNHKILMIIQTIRDKKGNVIFTQVRSICLMTWQHIYSASFALFYALLVIVHAAQAMAHAKEISEIFIEGTGSNQYEAQIMAHEHGMLRSLYLLADKLNLPVSAIDNIQYSELKNVFTPAIVKDEITTANRYTATVTYTYEPSNLYSLLLEHSQDQIKDKFYEFLILPVFKQKNILNIWNPEAKWNDLWGEARNVMLQHKILYPTKTLYYADKVTQNNIFKLQYKDYVSIFNNILFKNVMIVTSEFFTDRNTAHSIMQIKKYIISPKSEMPIVLEEDYDLHSWNEIPHITDLVIDGIIDDYGIHKTNTQDSIQLARDIDSDTTGKANLKPQTHERKNVTMIYEAFVADDIELIRSKLRAISIIDDFSINHDHGNKYKILISTNANDYELAEALYMHHLSYQQNNNEYNLIIIENIGS